MVWPPQGHGFCSLPVLSSGTHRPFWAKEKRREPIRGPAGMIIFSDLSSPQDLLAEQVPEFCSGMGGSGAAPALRQCWDPSGSQRLPHPAPGAPVCCRRGHRVWVRLSLWGPTPKRAPDLPSRVSDADPTQSFLRTPSSALTRAIAVPPSGLVFFPDFHFLPLTSVAASGMASTTSTQRFPAWVTAGALWALPPVLFGQLWLYVPESFCLPACTGEFAAESNARRGMAVRQSPPLRWGPLPP